MSRLIDADALTVSISKYSFYHENDRDMVCEIIRVQPTAEPERKKGRWVRITQGAIPEKYMCPFCHRTIENDGVESLLSMRFPFCHCGADMREGEQDG